MGDDYRDNELRTIIPGIQALIPDVCDFVVAAARRANLNDRAVYHCQMAVDEACTNIIEHGFGGTGQTGQIEIICRDEADRFTIQIVDNSSPFNPLQRHDPDPTTVLADRQAGGWGIYFIKQMMDDVQYELLDGHNTLTISKGKQPANLHATSEDLTAVSSVVQALGSDIWRVTPPDRLDSNSSPTLQAILEDQLAAGRVRLVVDMAEVVYISTSGLKTLVNVWREAQQQNGTLALVSLQPQILEVFETVGFDQIFAIYDSTDQAITRIAQ